MKHKIHYRNTRLYVNAGMRFPDCYLNDGPLDTDKTILPTSGEIFEVTCKRCIKKNKTVLRDWLAEK